MSIKLGILLALTGIVTAAFLFFSSLFLNQNMHQDVSRIGQEQIKNAVSAQLVRDVTILSATLAENLIKPLYDYDFSAIKVVIDELAQSGELDYVYVFDIDNNIVHDGTAAIDHFGQSLSQLEQVKLTPSGKLQIKRIGRIIHLMEPIKTTDVVFGGITFGIKFKKAEQDILKYSSEVAQVNEFYYSKLLMSMAFVLGGLIITVVPVAFVLARQLLSPLQELARKSQSIDHHQKVVSFALERDDEIGQLANALEAMTTRLSESHQEMINIAFLDELTSLPNRRYFNENLPKLIDWCDQYNTSFAILFIDLDHFKQINDNLGHDIGDALLVAVARKMQLVTDNFCDQNHLPGGDKKIVARLGGDEFVVVIAQCTEPQKIMQFANELIDAFIAPLSLENHEVTASLSIGVTTYPDHAATINELLKNADLAMYEAKKRGRSCAYLFNHSMKEEFRLNNIIKQELDSALESNQLFIEYQPYHSLRLNKIVGATAIVRWRHPEYGIISAETLNEVLEDNETICALTRWTVNQVCRDSALLDQQGIECLLSINVSYLSLIDVELGAAITQLLINYHRPSQSICLQLTETAIATDVKHCAQIFASWKLAGAKIWIDKFGIGYSSLRYLNQLPIDVLKIDESFVGDLNTDVPNPVIKSIYALAQAMSIDVVAQGVKTPLQAYNCQQLGSDVVQGTLYSGPLSLDEFIIKMEFTRNEKIN